MTDNRGKWLSCLLFLTMAMSSFVFIEPSPYDLFIILIMVIGFIFSIYNFTKEMIFPLLILYLFLISNLLSLFFIKEIGSSIFFTSITFYLAFTWIGLIGMSELIKPLYLQRILQGFLFSALISAVIGILAYFHLLTSSDFFLLYGRAKALFKDPNVFGPFLVMPALFSIRMAELKDTTIKMRIFYNITFLILSAGIVLSFSRAAWGNFAISLLIFLFLFKVNFLRSRIHTIIFIVLLGIPGILYFIQTPMVEDLLVSRLSYQSYDINRFGTQHAAFEKGLSNPFGIGAGQSDEVFQYSPHSLYVRIFIENGVLGLISFVVFFILSVIKSYQSYRYTKGESSGLFLVIFASLVGIAFNSFFIDTLHWRHLWVLLAFAWFPALENKDKK